MIHLKTKYLPKSNITILSAVRYMPVNCNNPKLLPKRNIYSKLSKYDYIVFHGVLYKTDELLNNNYCNFFNLHTPTCHSDNIKNLYESLSLENGFAIKTNEGIIIVESLYMVVGCGKCSQCRFKRVQEWQNRATLEMVDNPNCTMLTLTYNEENLPKDKMLCYNDVQLFLKRLRIYLQRNYDKNNKIRFIACGEYGHNNHRPHYHLLIFGMPDVRKNKHDKCPLFMRQNGIFAFCWDKGYTYTVTNVDTKACRYITKYMLKEDEWINQQVQLNGNFIKPFVRSSSRPGIGGNYLTYERLLNILERESLELIYSDQNGNVCTMPIPRFITRKVFPNLSDITLYHKLPYGKSITIGEYEYVITPLTLSKAIKLTQERNYYNDLFNCCEVWLSTAKLPVLYDDDPTDPLHINKLPIKVDLRYYQPSGKLLGLLETETICVSTHEQVVYYKNHAQRVLTLLDTVLSLYSLPANCQDLLEQRQRYENQITDYLTETFNKLDSGALQMCDLYTNRNLLIQNQLNRNNISRDNQ